MSYYGTGFPPGVMPMTPPGNYGMPYGGPAGPAGPMTVAAQPQPLYPQPGGMPGYPQPYGVGPMMAGSPPTDIYVRRPC